MRCSYMVEYKTVHSEMGAKNFVPIGVIASGDGEFAFDYSPGNESRKIELEEIARNAKKNGMDPEELMDYLWETHSIYVGKYTQAIEEEHDSLADCIRSVLLRFQTGGA